MEDGGWRMEDGGWRIEDGGWRMEDGGWRKMSEVVGNCRKLSENVGFVGFVGKCRKSMICLSALSVPRLSVRLSDELHGISV